MKILKFAFGLVCLLILASNIRVMSHWTEARGVWDDVCYLRQAHLFRVHGWGGFNTDASRDEDRFLRNKLDEIGFPAKDPAPCHPPNAAGRYVLQYPPGTGFLLALFPEGYQVVPLYLSASVIIVGLAMLAIFGAQSTMAVLGAGLLGALSVYMMINPAKASYSIAPTMAAGVLVAFLTAQWLLRARTSIALPLLIGLLLGLSVNLRLANLFLAAGYAVFLGLEFLRARTTTTFTQGFVFACAFVCGIAPTLIANAINAGSPLTTTYSPDDATPPEVNLAVLSQYLHDMQFVLIVLAVGSTAWLLLTAQRGGRQVALLVGANLLINLGFFLSHPVFTPYYVVPIAILSIWSICFAGAMESAEAAGKDRAMRPAV